MLEITPEAQTAIKAAMDERNLDQAIRVYLGGGCSGTQLVLGLDEVRDTDLQYEVAGFTYVVDKELADQTGELKIDFVDDNIRKGVLISSANPLPQGPSCGSGCSC